MKVSCRVTCGIVLAACVAGCGGATTQQSTSASAGSTSALVVTSTGAKTETSPAPPIVPHAASVDSFAGQLSNATGRQAGAQDELQIVLAPGAGPTAGVRRLGITLTRSRCSGKPRCLLLAGELAGRIVEARTIPDRGRAFSIVAVGVIKPLGRVSAIGVVTGVGNARFGRESLRLRLSGGSGSVVVSGQSARLPGFSSP